MAQIPRLGFAVAFLVATAAVAWIFGKYESGRTPSVPRPDLERVPDVVLETRDGTKVSTTDLRGSVWVAVFPNGPGGHATAPVAALENEMARSNGVRVVVFCPDPDAKVPEESPDVADPVGWTLVAGPPEGISEIKRAFLRALEHRHGPVEGGLAHVAVVVDRSGMIRSFQSFNDPRIVPKLLMDIGDALNEGRAR
jgi:cytochrome oxidase Cu insertion factor (SCO1/SenC/PrrC family)